MTVNLLTEDLDETSIPEKFKEPETGAVRLQDLINSYNALERKMGEAIPVPKTPEEYCIDCEHGLFGPDADINRRMHEKGFTNDQAQEVYNMAAEKMVPMVKEVAGEFKADQEVEKLVTHFGGAEKWREVSRQLLAFGQKHLPEDVLDTLSSSFDGVLALHRMIQVGEPGLNKNATKAEKVDTKDLNSMMRDPRYWRDKDPAFIEKVTQGFRQVYGQQ